MDSRKFAYLSGPWLGCLLLANAFGGTSASWPDCAADVDESIRDSVLAANVPSYDYVREKGKFAFQYAKGEMVEQTLGLDADTYADFTVSGLPEGMTLEQPCPLSTYATLHIHSPVAGTFHPILRAFNKYGGDSITLVIEITGDADPSPIASVKGSGKAPSQDPKPAWTGRFRERCDCDINGRKTPLRTGAKALRAR